MAKSKPKKPSPRTPSKRSGKTKLTSGKKKSSKATKKSPARKLLMAPWRIEFILGPREKDCFFCVAAHLDPKDQQMWKQRLLLYRDDHALVLMNKYPYTGGHLLIAPLRHTCEAEKLTEAESYSMWRLSFLCVEVLKKVMSPQGFNLGMNLGKAAGAGIEDHLHMHAMPRWVGDTNFLPVIGDTHTIPVALEDLWDELRPAFVSAAKEAGLSGV